MLQAESRAHRIGQTKPVTVYKLCTQGTVEEQMMGRIQKKLYLSAKVTESMRNVHGESKSKRKGSAGEAPSDDTPQLGTNELMALVRRGAQALSHPEINATEISKWDWDTMLEKCQTKPSGHTTDTTDPQIKEEEEKKWLAKLEQVETRVFEGKKVSKRKAVKETALDLEREERRQGKNTTVMVNGYAISKESMGCADWEAVPTFAGKDPRLAEPVRAKKAKIINQEVSLHSN